MTKSILGWLCAVMLCVLYSFWLSAYGLLLFPMDSLSAYLPLLFITLLTFLTGISLALTRVLTRACRRRGWDKSGHWRCTIIVLLFIPLVAILVDSPPIEKDYVLQDVVADDQRILESYDTLMLFHRNGGIKLEAVITPQIQTNAVAHSELIYRTWDSISETRAIIDKLNTYPGIADITPQVSINMNTPVLDLVTLRSIARTYAAYARLKTDEGQPDEGVQHLATFHSVTRRALPHTAMLMNKMIWIAIAKNNIETAFSIMQDPRCTDESLEILQKVFSSIPEDHVSLRRVLIGEYLWFKTVFSAELKGCNFFDAFSMTEVGKSPKAATLLRRTASFLVYHLTVKRNRTFRDLRSHYDLFIDGAGKRPPDMTAAETFADTYSRRPDIRNLGGWYLVSIAVPSLARSNESAIQTKILSDLLAIEIGDRLNQAVAIKDYYSDGPYKRDEQSGRVFSVGPDMKPGTDDDIMLGKQ